MKNLVLGYLHAPDRKKQEVLSLISKILGFTQEELDQVCVYVEREENTQLQCLVCISLRL